MTYQTYTVDAFSTHQTSEFVRRLTAKLRTLEEELQIAWDTEFAMVVATTKVRSYKETLVIGRPTFPPTIAIIADKREYFVQLPLLSGKVVRERGNMEVSPAHFPTTNLTIEPLVAEALGEPLILPSGPRESTCHRYGTRIVLGEENIRRYLRNPSAAAIHINQHARICITNIPEPTQPRKKSGEAKIFEELRAALSIS
ncbi:MAG TPA: hypothetical protein VJB87_00115 [Candidatus Nanoarchaeia archaeon]|nr:hypothetical protein [Candidatus Nanoarchaeia archaeon]